MYISRVIFLIKAILGEEILTLGLPIIISLGIIVGIFMLIYRLIVDFFS